MANTVDSGPPTMFRLMDLPNEITSEICNRPELEKKDLRSLRLTCKHLCEFTSKRFARESFSRITVLMMHSSLRAFIELSQHPYFGPVVQKINISPMFASYDGLAGYPGLEASENTATGPLGYSLDTTELVTTFLTRSRKEIRLRTEGYAERMLSVAFKAFAQRNQSFHLQFSQNESNAIGAMDSAYDVYLGPSRAWRLDWKTTIQQTMRAIAIQGCNVTALLINDLCRDDCVYDSGLYTNEIQHQLSALCLQLTSLEIWFGHSDTESTVQSVMRMVSKATNLKSLRLMRLGKEDSYVSQEIPDILEYVASTSLETVMMASFHAFEGELHEFLIRQRDTLRDLRLLYGCLTQGSCMSLIAWIKDNLPNLVSLLFEEICGSTDHADCREEDYKSYRIRRGEDMQARLADILDGKHHEKVRVEEVNEIEQDDEGT